MSVKRIGILTGGGVPGINSVIRPVVYWAGDMGAEVTGNRGACMR